MIDPPNPSVYTAVNTMNQRRSVAQSTGHFQTPLLSQALLLAILCSHVTTVTASPLPSLPASAPGFHSGTVSTIHDAASEPWSDTPDLDPVATVSDLDLDVEEAEDDDWHLEYDEVVANDDERMGVDGMGKAIAKEFNSSAG